MIYRKIADFTLVVTGGTPSTKVKDYWENGNIPWLQSGCCQNCDVNKADKFITQKGYDNSSAKLMPSNTVMIALTGATAGKIGYLNFEACGNQSITGILPCDTINQRYLYYYLLSLRNKILLDCVGGAQHHISQEYVKNIQVPVMDLSEQEQVAKIFLELENLIRTRKKELQTLDDLIKARFIEMFGNYPYDSAIGDLTNISRGASPRPISNYITSDESGENWIKIGDADENDVYITKAKEKVTKVGADKSRRVKEGDFILSNSMSFGRPYILGINGCVHDGWLIISDYSDSFVPLFFYYLLRSENVQSQFNGSVNGAVVKNLNSDLVRKTKVCVPPLDKQIEFVKFVEQIDKSKLAMRQSLEKTQQLYDSLMQEYFG